MQDNPIKEEGKGHKSSTIGSLDADSLTQLGQFISKPQSILYPFCKCEVFCDHLKACFPFGGPCINRHRPTHNDIKAVKRNTKVYYATIRANILGHNDEAE